MALVVSTSPPELVVKTKVRKPRIQPEESSFLCDQFWACVLDDYLEDETDVSILEKTDHSEKKSRPKSIRSKKKSRNKKYQEAVEELSPAPATIGGDLDALLSDDHEEDHRENEATGLSRQDPADQPSQRDVLETVDEEEELEDTYHEPEEETIKDKDFNSRLNDPPAEFKSQPTQYQLRLTHSESRPERDDSDGAIDLRSRSTEVFQYAPLLYRKQLASNDPLRRSASHGEKKLQLAPWPQTDDSKFSIDPEEDEGAPSRPPRSRRSAEIPPSHRHMNVVSTSTSLLPRSPSSSRAQSYHSRTPVLITERPRKSKSTLDGRVKTIDLTSETYNDKSTRSRMAKPQSNATLSDIDTEESWLAQESKRIESDYRRRKLDRKEALVRIRAIKARLHKGGDP